MCELFEVLWPELVHKLPPKEAVCRSGQRKTPHERGRSHVSVILGQLGGSGDRGAVLLALKD